MRMACSERDMWGFRRARLSRTLSGTASWERGRPARKWDGEAAADQCRRGARVWKTHRSQDAVPAQVDPWGEIRQQPPRTGPKPRKNAVSVGVKNISPPDLYPLYQ